MRIKHYANGKTETVPAGAILAGCRLSEVTFTADDVDGIIRNVSRELFAEWFYNVVLTRFPSASAANKLTKSEEAET